MCFLSFSEKNYDFEQKRSYLNDKKNSEWESQKLPSIRSLY